MLGIGFSANPTGIADAFPFIIHELIARFFVRLRLPEHTLIQPQGHPHPVVIADQDLKREGQLGRSRSCLSRGRHPLQTVSRRLIAPPS